jgi:hypothetical protein
MYSRVFTKARWKKEGGIVSDFIKSESSYIRRTPIPAYPSTEAIIIKEFGNVLKRKGYISNTQKNVENKKENLT